MRWRSLSERKVRWTQLHGGNRLLTSMTSSTLIYTCTGVNSFKMFMAYKDVFMIRDDEVVMFGSSI